METGKILPNDILYKCEHITTFGIYDIYVFYDYYTYLIAIDNHHLICSYFEFHETEEKLQLAHMYTLESLIGNGIGKAILKQAVNLWDDFYLPSTDNKDKYYYIQDGYGFILSCFNNGILTDPPFKHPQRYL